MASVLVVDDEEALRSFLAEALLDEGHLVREAGDGEAALRALSKQSFEVVLTDLKMPRMGGMELLERLRRDQPEVEVIVITAHGTVDTALQAMKLGAFDYLQKPLSSPTELRLLVARAAERYRLRSLAEVTRRQDSPRLSYGAAAMVGVESALRKVAPTEATVLLLGRERHGQGGRRPGRARLERPRRGAVRRHQLRGALGEPAGERALRPREGIVYRRQLYARAGPLRGRGCAARCSSTRSETISPHGPGQAAEVSSQER